jgi:ribonuclease P protein component
MGKRADRLRQPQEFSAGLATKPVGRSGPFFVHAVKTSDQSKLGFILPNRFAKKAVLRNLIKRWARETFQKEISRSQEFCNVIVRLRQPLDIAGWGVQMRQQTRQDLYKAMKSVNQGTP